MKDVFRLVKVCALFSTCASWFCCSITQADEFTYLGPDGTLKKVEARLLGSNQTRHALLFPDGHLELIPTGVVKSRIRKTAPTPISPEQMAEQLKQKFGEESFRYAINQEYVIGLVLTAPLNKSEESKVRALLAKAGRFMQNVESSFVRFAKSVKLKPEEPEFPLVLLIFETDTTFEAFAREATGGRGLSAGNIAGFYSGLTNWLAIRLSECSTFEVPLHEAIHQQVYNRGLLQRLSPVPLWFGEGIATGFEGNGDRIRVSPLKINSSFAKRAMKGSRIDWNVVVGSDIPFRGDLLASEAYTHAWSMHWMLVTKYQEAYTNYFRNLGTKTTLEKNSGAERTKEFEQIFGKPVSEIQQEFPLVLKRIAARQKIKPEKTEPAGFSKTESHLGEARILAVEANGRLNVKGQLRNLSPIRAMDFYVILVTGSGAYADWYFPNVKSGKTVPLAPQVVSKRLAGTPGGLSRTFKVMIRSTVPGSKESEAWASGNRPQLRIR